MSLSLLYTPDTEWDVSYLYRMGPYTSVRRATGTVPSAFPSCPAQYDWDLKIGAYRLGSALYS